MVNVHRFAKHKQAANNRIFWKDAGNIECGFGGRKRETFGGE